MISYSFAQMLTDVGYIMLTWGMEWKGHTPPCQKVYAHKYFIEPILDDYC